ncbi:DUF6265 family protein [Lacinutrix sp. Bg11-31]|uniref:DUF6265 family protein n=1 Tax=Lacinutrix sp. Bg11-31 TaxID=2057808 RepID=UPI000C3050CD|nr:DUF6265 family protein [Lacinutrix sp. Bg11-31]AUC82793.1 hypothetical protein CW733_11940 [Lacinutrix sp. Bg11-31]
MKILALIIAIVFLSSCNAQQNILKFPENGKSPKANLNQVSWIEGRWLGEAFGGITEEIWSPPLGDSMMFSFKLVSEGKVVFYEFGGIRQVDDTLIFQLKHFENDFKGWEEKDETIDAKLVKIEDNRAYFDGFTFEKISDSEINIYVEMEEKSKTEELKFNYKKQ